MSAKERLQSVQTALQGRGVLDVKFCLAKGVADSGCAEVADRVATFLETYLNGKVKRVHGVGDLSIASAPV